MVEHINKLEAAFLAGRMDAMAAQGQPIPEGLQELLRMVLSESDCAALSRLSKVLFQQKTDQKVDVSLRLISPLKLLTVGSHNGGTNGAKPEVS